MLPAQIVDEFRTVALDRLKRIDASWMALTSSPDHGEHAAVMHREAHNLKGESRLVGFTDVNLLCHKLEDLFELARDRRYQVSDDFNFAITMVTRFIAMLVRKRVGTSLGGLDLPGFITHLDAVLIDAKLATSLHVSQRIPTRSATRARLPPEVRDRVSLAAVDVFIEGLARGRRGRLESAWLGLRDLLVDERQPARQLEKHHDSSVTILRELGRIADVDFEVGDFELPVEILSALDVAALHLVRNAIDHGIAPPDQRLAAGRSPTGRVTVRALLADEVVTLTVADDGRGIDFDLVRTRALALGWLDADAAARASRDELTQLLMQPGFSTRSQATDLSGRGIGLDAVNAAVTGCGGKLSVVTSPGGTTWSVAIPVRTPLVTALTFRVPSMPIPFAIRADWEPCDATAVFIDLVVALGLGPATRDPASQFVVRRGGATVGFVTDAPPAVMQIQRLVLTPDNAVAEVALIEGIEGLLVRPERLL